MLVIQPKRASQIENKVIFSLSLTFYKKFKSVRYENMMKGLQNVAFATLPFYIIFAVRQPIFQGGHTHPWSGA